jgi:dihydroorotate dehydrogenase electron transfer subunit
MTSRRAGPDNERWGSALDKGNPEDGIAEVMTIRKERGGFFTALLHAPGIAKEARPMQFVEVRVREGADPFLRRPFGLSRISPEEGTIGLTWAVVGRGTALMSSWRPGDRASVLGPLGNGLDPEKLIGKSPAKARSVYLVAGGTGLAPFYPLAKAFRSHGVSVSLFYGARTSALLMDTSPFQSLGCRVTAYTEDGSEGAAGFVTVGLGQLRTLPLEDDRQCAPLVIACGPTAMLKAVKEKLAGTSAELYVSLEGRMACGTGLCKGCAVKAAPPLDGYLHVCTDGPVFPASMVCLGEEGEGI